MKPKKTAVVLLIPPIICASLDLRHPGHRPPHSPHGEERQYEPESKPTSPFNTMSTTTATVLPGSALFPLFAELEGPRFRVYFPTEKKQGR